MTASELSKLIQRQLEMRHLPGPLLHGIELDRALVPPQKIAAIDRLVVRGRIHDKNVEVWLVLHEKPDDPQSYRIVYSEERDCFGLATPGLATDTCLVVFGWYGDFANTLESM